jgi:hypothetical protein
VKGANPAAEIVIPMAHAGQLSDEPARTVADGTTTNLSNVIGSATGAFAQSDINATVTGNGIPVNTFIEALGPAVNQATLTKNATATAAGVSLTITPLGPAYPSYIANAMGVAAAYGAAMVNHWALGRNSWAYYLTRQFWGTTGSNSGAPGVDPAHPGDAGHLILYNDLKRVPNLT